MMVVSDVTIHHVVDSEYHYFRLCFPLHALCSSYIMSSLHEPIPSAPSMVHPVPQRPPSSGFFATTLLPRSPPSPRFAAPALPNHSPLLPPTPPTPTRATQFDPRYVPQFPSTLLYYTQDKQAFDRAERYRTSSLYWQHAYMKTYKELTGAIQTLEGRLQTIEEKVFVDELNISVSSHVLHHKRGDLTTCRPPAAIPPSRMPSILARQSQWISRPPKHQWLHSSLPSPTSTHLGRVKCQWNEHSSWRSRWGCISLVACGTASCQISSTSPQHARYLRPWIAEEATAHPRGRNR